MMRPSCLWGGRTAGISWGAREAPDVRPMPLTGTIIGIFAGALDGVHARLIRITPLGYTVELLESRGDFQPGDRVQVSGREFTLQQAARHRALPATPRGETVNGAAEPPPNGHPHPAVPRPLPTPLARAPQGGTRRRRDHRSPQP